MSNSIELASSPASGDGSGDIAIPINGQVTRRDLLQAHRLFYRPSPAALALRVALAALVIVFGAVVADVSGGRWLLWFSLLAALFMLTSPWSQPYLNMFTQWPRQAILREPWTGLATAQGLRLGGAHFNQDLAWDIFVLHKRSAEMLLLFPSPRSIIFIPRSLVASDADWQALGLLVESKVPAKLARGADPGAVVRRVILAIGVLFMIAMMVWMLRQNRSEEKEQAPRETARLVQARCLSI